MSGFAAILNLDGRPVDRDLLSRMIDAVPYRGPDGIHTWADGNVGLAHAMMCTTPESLHETQPLRNDDAGLVLTMDGRVDNREDLAAMLTAKGYRLRDDTDADLVMRAYECWGEDSPVKIIGDFAYVIWDARRRRLFCARDPIGVKPFYYWSDSRTFICASELQQILKCPQVPSEPNEGMIGEVLADRVTSRDETLYRSVFRLPQSRCLTVNSSGLRSLVYFDLRNAPRIRYKIDEEYASHFRELMMNAVGAALRSSVRVGVNVSGGLDSSAIVGCVHALRRNGHSASYPIEGFFVSLPDPKADERSFVNQVGRTWGMEIHSCGAFAPNRQYCLMETQVSRVLPGYPNGVFLRNLQNVQKERGCGVVLTGYGGDEILSGSVYRFADLLRRCRLSLVARELIAVARSHKADPFNYPWSATRQLTRGGLLPIFSSLVPRSVRYRLKSLLQSERIPSYIDAQFARRVKLQERFEVGRAETVCELHSQSGMCNAFAFGWNPWGLEADDLVLAKVGQEQRHPFYFRPLIEFCFGIPEEQRQRNAVPKFLLRHALADLLPREVFERQSKAEFSITFTDALQGVRADDAFKALRYPVAGWVNRAELRRLYDNMISLLNNGEPASSTAGSGLWCAFAVNLWYEACFGLRDLKRSEARVVAR